MKVTDVHALPIGPNPHHVDARKIYDTEHATAVVITLRPGEGLKRHITPVDVFFYVLDGTGIVEIGDERQSVDRDHIVESPAGIPHRWSNEGDADFRVLVVKVPRPTTGTKLL
ncbi:cupin domain-containing protein [Methanofollis fontis]|uniref:Cupin domain-containing protein n=1 Tax=Methanofollis fontis TaxID=2052832 RepID=A0A483CYY6_9EURY|nr:cupin domain-containing protein [Methanofollis fontis]TAJ45036.1 cupin domain-containing protein [Methanofollis fontis]